jgi:hypothetical protein
MLEARRGGRVDFGYIIGDPFALATISIALVGHSANTSDDTADQRRSWLG